MLVNPRYPESSFNIQTFLNLPNDVVLVSDNPKSPVRPLSLAALQWGPAAHDDETPVRERRSFSSDAVNEVKINRPLLHRSRFLEATVSFPGGKAHQRSSCRVVKSICRWAALNSTEPPLVKYDLNIKTPLRRSTADRVSHRNPGIGQKVSSFIPSLHCPSTESSDHHHEDVQPLSTKNRKRPIAIQIASKPYYDETHSPRSTATLRQPVRRPSPPRPEMDNLQPSKGTVSSARKSIQRKRLTPTNSLELLLSPKARLAPRRRGRRNGVDNSRLLLQQQQRLSGITVDLTSDDDDDDGLCQEVHKCLTLSVPLLDV